MSFWDKNSVLFAAKGNMAQHLINHLEQIPSAIIEDKKNEVWWHSENQGPLLIDSPEIRDQVLSHLTTTPCHPRSLFIICGAGFGDYLEILLKQYPQSRFLVIEHDARLIKNLLTERDVRDLIQDDRIEWAIGYEFESLRYYLKHFFHTRDFSRFLLQVQFVRHPSLNLLSKNYFDTVEALWREELHFFNTASIGNSIEDQRLGLCEVAANLTHLHKMAALEPYKNSFTETTGIVISSGPSLESKWDYLRAHCQNVPMICADSALRACLKNGVKPFGVACVERDQVNADCFKGFEIPNDIILFAPPLIKEETIRNYPGPIVTLFRTAFPFPSLPPLLPMRFFGTSCAHLAFYVLDWLGCNKIGLIGQDLAYQRLGGASHFDDAFEFCHEQFRAPEQKRFEAPDNQDGTIATNSTWLGFRDIFARMLRERPRQNVFNIIAAEDGLFIPGTQRINAAEFFKQLPNRPFQFSTSPGHLFMKEAFAKNSFSPKIFLEQILNEISNHLGRIESWFAAENVDAFYARKDKDFESFNPFFMKLLRDLFRPVQIHFEMKTNSQYSVGEFNQEKIKIKKIWMETLAKVQKDLKTAYELCAPGEF